MIRSIATGLQMRWKRAAFITLIVVIAVLHLYKLSEIPPGLSNDEANIGYEAWSIATTGKDQWGNSFPVVFEGFGNWSLPVYIYLLAPFIKIFGPSIIAVRLLSLISAVTLSGLSYVLLQELRKTPYDWLALLASVFVGFTPWIFGLSRTANEATLAVTLFVAGLIFFLRSEKRKASMIGSMAFFSLALLTYYGMWIFIPLFLLTVGVLGRRTVEFRQKDRIVGIGIGSILILILVFISFRQGGIKRLNQVNIFNDPALIGALNEKRGSCIEAYPSFICRLFFNKPTMYTATFLSNYASHFSLREWFISNSAGGILPPGGFFMLVQASLFFIGILVLLKLGSQTEKRTFFSWLLLAPLADSVTSAGNFTRSFMIAPAIAIVCAYSFLAFPKMVRLFVFSLFSLSAVSFFLVYTSLFPKANSMYTHYEYQPLVGYLKDEKLPIYVSSRHRDTKQYIFLLFYGRISPQDFQHDATVVREREENGWIWVKQVNNWRFEKSIPKIEDLPQDSILVGATKEEIDPLLKQYERCYGLQLKPQTTITYLNGNPAFSILEIKKTGNINCPKSDAL